VIHLFLKLAGSVDEAVSFVFAQLIEQVTGIRVYDKRYPDYASQDKRM
jgi:hypothetical protein